MVSGSGAKRAGPGSGARFESTIAAAPWVLSPPDRGYESPPTPETVAALVSLTSLP